MTIKRSQNNFTFLYSREVVVLNFLCHLVNDSKHALKKVAGQFISRKLKGFLISNHGYKEIIFIGMISEFFVQR